MVPNRAWSIYSEKTNLQTRLRDSFFYKHAMFVLCFISENLKKQKEQIYHTRQRLLSSLLMEV